MATHHVCKMLLCLSLCPPGWQQEQTTWAPQEQPQQEWSKEEEQGWKGTTWKAGELEQVCAGTELLVHLSNMASEFCGFEIESDWNKPDVKEGKSWEQDRPTWYIAACIESFCFILWLYVHQKGS